jgi:hypothetical protein
LAKANGNLGGGGDENCQRAAIRRGGGKNCQRAAIEEEAMKLSKSCFMPTVPGDENGAALAGPEAITTGFDRVSDPYLFLLFLLFRGYPKKALTTDEDE